MGLKLQVDLDTSLGSSNKVYLRIDNINLNRVFRTVKVAVTYWYDKSFADASRKKVKSGFSKGLIENKVVLYTTEDSLGTELELPTHFEFSMTNPEEVEVPVYEDVPVDVEVPYIGFDKQGRRVTKYRTETKLERHQIGTRKDTNQVLDLDIETGLVSWCYGQIKAILGKQIPVEFLKEA